MTVWQTRLMCENGLSFSSQTVFFTICGATGCAWFASGAFWGG